MRGTQADIDTREVLEWLLGTNGKRSTPSKSRISRRRHSGKEGGGGYLWVGDATPSKDESKGTHQPGHMGSPSMNQKGNLNIHPPCFAKCGEIYSITGRNFFYATLHLLVAVLARYTMCGTMPPKYAMTLRYGKEGHAGSAWLPMMRS